MPYKFKNSEKGGLVTRGLNENEFAALNKLKLTLLEKFPVIDIRLFGSKARHDSSPDSDIDVWIELEYRDYEIEREIFDIIYDINLDYDVLIMPLYISKNQIDNGPMSESPIYKAIIRDGVPL